MPRSSRSRRWLLGAANIVINDDGGNASGWFDADTAEYIPVAYTQADVEVSAGRAPVITVTDSVVEVDDLLVPFGQVTEGVTSARADGYCHEYRQRRISCSVRGAWPCDPVRSPYAPET